MAEPVLSRVVHSIARRMWGPTLRQFGFRNSPGASVASWAKPYQGRKVFISWQLAWYGWFEESGSMFTVELERGVLRRGTGGMDDCVRFSEYMPPEVLAEAEVIYADMLLQFPEGPPLGDQRPFVPGQDIWLPYYTPDDVERWATFLLPHLPTLLNGHASGITG